MRRVLSFLILLTMLASAASSLELSGAIGPYKIEVELDRSEDRLIGRYRYAGQDAWISLSGETFGSDALQLEENVSGTVTGQFYLGHVDQRLEGYWANDTSDYEVRLTPVNGRTDTLFDRETLPDVNAFPTGQYDTGGYWVNDWFAPRYEIGFNGGQVNVVEVTTDQILVWFDFVVGPTYHFASFRGMATQSEDGTFVHDAVLPGGDEPCRLVFRFDGTLLSIEDEGNGFACQFGARAHANFTLQKSSNIAEFGFTR